MLPKREGYRDPKKGMIRETGSPEGKDRDPRKGMIREWGAQEFFEIREFIGPYEP